QNAHVRSLSQPRRNARLEIDQRSHASHRRDRLLAIGLSATMIPAVPPWKKRPPQYISLSPRHRGACVSFEMDNQGTDGQAKPATPYDTKTPKCSLLSLRRHSC